MDLMHAPLDTRDMTDAELAALNRDLDRQILAIFDSYENERDSTTFCLLAYKLFRQRLAITLERQRRDTTFNETAARE